MNHANGMTNILANSNSNRVQGAIDFFRMSGTSRGTHPRKSLAALRPEEVSALTIRARSDDGVRPARVVDLRRRIAAGTYSVSASYLADSLMLAMSL
jgi:anti-sigma28 factor (negative regulator of flagellin synthesis)